MYSQEQVNKLLQAATPDVLSSSVLIVGAKKSSWGAMGSGVLFQIADYHFVVTAAHTIRCAYSNSITLGMSCDDNRFLVFRSDFDVSDLASFFNFDDILDIAIYKLNSEEIGRLKSSRFLRQSDVANVLENGICTVFGYPSALADKPRNNEPLNVKGLTFTVPIYTGTTDGFDNFDNKYSFLLDASWSSSGVDGRSLQMSDLSDRAANTLRDLKGLSGGPVWMVGTSGTNPATWGRDLPKLVGLQVGVYPERDLVRATRWSVVLGFLKRRYPELSQALELAI